MEDSARGGRGGEASRGKWRYTFTIHYVPSGVRTVTPHPRGVTTSPTPITHRGAALSSPASDIMAIPSPSMAAGASHSPSQLPPLSDNTEAHSGAETSGRGPSTQISNHYGPVLSVTSTLAPTPQAPTHYNIEAHLPHSVNSGQLHKDKDPPAAGATGRGGQKEDVPQYDVTVVDTGANEERSKRGDSNSKTGVDLYRSGAAILDPDQNHSSSTVLPTTHMDIQNPEPGSQPAPHPAVPPSKSGTADVMDTQTEFYTSPSTTTSSDSQEGRHEVLNDAGPPGNAPQLNTDAKTGNSNHNMQARVTMHHHGNDDTFRDSQENHEPFLSSISSTVQPSSQSAMGVQGEKEGKGYRAVMEGASGSQALEQDNREEQDTGGLQGALAGNERGGAQGSTISGGDTGNGGSGAIDNRALRSPTHTTIQGHILPTTKPTSDSVRARLGVGQAERAPIMQSTIVAASPQREPPNIVTPAMGTESEQHEGSSSVIHKDKPDQGDLVNSEEAVRHATFSTTSPANTARKSHTKMETSSGRGRLPLTPPSTDQIQHTGKVQSDSQANGLVTSDGELVKPTALGSEGSHEQGFAKDCRDTTGPCVPDITPSSVKPNTTHNPDTPTPKHSSFITLSAVESEEYTRSLDGAGSTVGFGEVEGMKEPSDQENVQSPANAPLPTSGVSRSALPSAGYDAGAKSHTTSTITFTTTTVIASTQPTNNQYPDGPNNDRHNQKTREHIPRAPNSTGTPSTPPPASSTTNRMASRRPRPGRNKSATSNPSIRDKPTDVILPESMWSTPGTPSTTPQVAMGSGLPSNSTLALSPSTLGTAEITGIAMACLVVFWLILGPFICLLMRTKDKNKSKRRERVRSTDSMSHVLVEEMIRMELARGRAKMYRTNVHDEREIQRLPSCNGYQDSPTKHSVSVDGITALRNHCAHSDSHHSESPLCNSTSYERTPFALACMKGSGSGKERHLLSVQNNMCFEGTPSKDQLEALSRGHKMAASTSDPSTVNMDPRGMVPSRSEPLNGTPPPPLPPRVPLRRKLDSDSSVLSEKSTQTPPWEHRHRRRGMKGLGDAYSPQTRRSPLQQVPPVPKPRQTKSKSPRPQPHKPPRKGAINSPRVPKSVTPIDDKDSAYVDCLLPQRSNGNISHRSPQRLYNFDKMNGNVPSKHHVADIIRDIHPMHSPLIPRTPNPYLDNSSEKFYESDPESGDSLDKPPPTTPWTYLPETNLNVQRGAKFANHAYVPIHDTKL